METAKPKGSLTIVGSGIASIADLTLGAVSQIEHADRVFYCVADPATAAFIRGKNPACEDLYVYYDQGKNRTDTYCQMAEVMLTAVRRGCAVVGVFYGHPGFFVAPSHRAIAIARAEGFHARMAAGVSAEDALWADLGIDPCKHGALTYEVSDLLLRARPLLPSSHLVLFQAGLVGEGGFAFGGFANPHVDLLLARLQAAYGPHHPVVHYVAAVLPGARPTLERITLATLRTDPAARARLSGISTLYLPPRELRPTRPAALHSMGLLPAGADLPGGAAAAPFPPSPLMAHLYPREAPAYSARDRAAVAALRAHKVPDRYRPLSASAAMREATRRLALDPGALDGYVADPHGVARRIPRLQPREREALASGVPARVRAAMTAAPKGCDADNEPPVDTENCIEIVVTVLGEEGRAGKTEVVG